MFVVESLVIYRNLSRHQVLCLLVLQLLSYVSQMTRRNGQTVHLLIICGILDNYLVCSLCCGVIILKVKLT